MKPTAPRQAAVIDLFTRQPWQASAAQRYIRLAPEMDGLEMLYSNDSNPDKLFSMKILCWGLRADGSVVGMVPWLTDICACPEICDPLNGHFEGYYDPGIDDVFWEAPAHKVVELESAAEYYEVESEDPDEVVQEIPDNLGTHAVFTQNGFRTLTLVEVLSWRLYNDGAIRGMLVDDTRVESTPVLPGDDCLYPAQEQDGFRYFFQHRIANKIKARDPEALAAIALLMDS